MLNIITGNLLESNDQYICHQCNAVSTFAAGLAKDIFSKYPYSDIYSLRKGDSVKEEEKPGNIIISGNGNNERYIINMIGQYYPGYSFYPNSKLDSPSVREQYFLNCLNKISTIKNLKVIAFPWLIGCGLAGGNWNNYKSMLENFANKNSNFIVNIYKLPEFKDE